MLPTAVGNEDGMREESCESRALANPVHREVPPSAPGRNAAQSVISKSRCPYESFVVYAHTHLTLWTFSQWRNILPLVPQSICRPIVSSRRPQNNDVQPVREWLDDVASSARLSHSLVDGNFSVKFVDFFFFFNVPAHLSRVMTNVAFCPSCNRRFHSHGRLLTWSGGGIVWEIRWETINASWPVSIAPLPLFFLFYILVVIDDVDDDFCPGAGPLGPNQMVSAPFELLSRRCCRTLPCHEVKCLVNNEMTVARWATLSVTGLDQ